MNGYTWKVIGQVPDQQFGPNNQQVTGKTVSFEMSSGYTGSVFIPDVVYQYPDEVRKMIQAEADKVAAVHQLSSEG